MLAKAQCVGRTTNPLHVGSEGPAALGGADDVHAQSLALTGVDEVEVRRDAIGADAIDIDGGQGAGQGVSIRLEALTVRLGLSIPVGPRALANGDELAGGDLLPVEDLLDEPGDAVDEGRVGEQRLPVLASPAGNVAGERELLLGRHDIVGRDIT